MWIDGDPGITDVESAQLSYLIGELDWGVEISGAIWKNHMPSFLKSMWF